MATSSNLVGPLRLSQTQAEVFTKAVRYILTEWPSLNFAIENGMGGSDAKQKREWMCDHIVEVMVQGNDLDLEDYLAEMINQEFDTIVEDGSLEYNTQWISKFFKDCLQGKEQEVMNSINRASANNQSLGNMRIPQPQNMNRDSDDDDSYDDDDKDDMD